MFYQSLIILIQSILYKFAHRGVKVSEYRHETLKFSVKIISLISGVNFDNSAKGFFPVYFIAKDYIN